MKNLSIPVVGLLTLLAACKKQDVAEEPQQEARPLGMLVDDPAKIANLSVIVSRDFLARSAGSKGPTKGKGGSGGGGTTADVTAPSVAITSPANGSSIGDQVSITVASSDNVGVTQVVLYINGAVHASSTSANPTFTWNASTAANGTHTIEATARDAAGNTNSTAIAVTKNAVVIDPPPPTSSGYSLVMPAIANQGTEFSCVAFAVGYAARSAEQYYRTGATSYSFSSNIFSPEHLYNVNKVSADCSSGSSIITNLDYLKANGVATWNTMPYSSSNGCSLFPNSSQLAEAASFRISNYSGISKSDVAGIKAALHQKKPLVIGLNVDQSFQYAKTGFIWKSYSSSPIGGHAVTIVGYDDSKNAWKIMNSWGTGWGDAGYGWIDYNFLPQAGGGSWAFLLNL